MSPYTSLAKKASIIADEWATGKFDGRANAHPGPPLATLLVSWLVRGISVAPQPFATQGHHRRYTRPLSRVARLPLTFLFSIGYKIMVPRTQLLKPI